MRWIKKSIKWTVVYFILPFIIVELILVTLIFTGVVNLNPILIPPYLKQDEANLIGDFDRLQNGKENIFFLGDSYTEGLQVERQETFSSLIDEYYPKKNVINLGASGTGTIAQMLRYKSVRSTPNVSDVVLFFLPQNDVLNSHQRFHEQFGLPNAPYFVSDSIMVMSTKSEHRGKIRNFAKNIISLRIVYRSYLQSLIDPSLEDFDQKIDGSILDKDRLSWFDVYREPSDSTWQEAWDYTERSFLELKRLTAEDDVRLHIVIVADSLQIFHYKKPLDEYDFNYPNNRLMNFCNENAMNCYDSLPYFLEYLDNNDLVFPYFSFENDGHYAQLGHKVMASFLRDLDLFK